MTYIEKLENIIVQHYEGYMALHNAETRLENTAYKGDARKKADEARKHYNQIISELGILVAKIKKKEVANV